MKNEFEKIKVTVGITIFLEIVAIILGVMLFGTNLMFTGTVALVLNCVLIYYVIKVYDTQISKKVIDVSDILGNDAKDAFKYGKLGLVIYDENYNITWMSDFFEKYELDFVGEKLSTLVTDVNMLLTGEEKKLIVSYEGNDFEVINKVETRILFFKDITSELFYKTRYENDKVVLGMIHMDNYEETTQYADEGLISFVNAKLRQPVIEWARNYGMIIRRIKQDRFLVVLNEEIFAKVVEDRFSILSYIRNVSKENDTAITLSMAFAREAKNFAQLDEMVNSSLELAQSRGGDQVAIKKEGESVKYFGGGSEALEKRSRVRVRVIAQTLRDLIIHASNVIILGHKDMDFDCMGAALGVSRLVSAYDKKAYILSKTGGIEEKLNESLKKYQNELNERHNFVSDKEALELLNEDTLVIMVDHHSRAQSNGEPIITKAEKIVVIDHHRRAGDFRFNPLMVYIESAASSVSELVTEFFPYQSMKVDISEEEAVIMLTGIVVDTNRFRVRTGTRTFEAAALLKEYGADPIVSNSFLKDSFDEFELKTRILNQCERRENGVIIAPYTDSILTRSLMSQVADSVLGISGVEVAFIVSKIDENQVAISARSKGNTNVQVIMEKMKGGGHFTAAALQRENTEVVELVKELDQVLEEYFKEVKSDESNITK